MTPTTVNPDTVSIDAIIKALYESISGPAGAPRQWDRDRALYAPGALLIPMRLPSVRKDGLGAAAENPASMYIDPSLDRDRTVAWFYTPITGVVTG